MILNYKLKIVNIVASLALLNSVMAKDLNDPTITQEFYSLINKESDLPGDKLKVSTKDRVIILDGTVDTRLQADKIVELANSIENVKYVDTYNLKVTDSKQYLKDALLTSAVKGKIMYLYNNGKIEKSNIHVETTNGSVHLFGNIGNKEDVSILKRELNRIRGVKSVHCNLEEMN